MPEFTDRVFAAVRKVPRGKVASYGMVAKVAGYPRAARQVGMVMRLGHGLPWWRVLAADGRIVIADPQWKMEQALRLETEGVVVREMRVDMERFGWEPRLTAPKSSTPKPSTPKKPQAKPSPARAEGSPRSPARRPRSSSSKKRR